MAKLEEKNKLDYRPGGDTVDDFAQKYMAEMTRIYQFLNNLRTHSTEGVEYVEPEPYQFKCEDEKLYIRNKANDEWVLLMDISQYGGYDKLLQKINQINGIPVTTEGIEDGQVMVYRESEKGFVPENKGGSLGTGKALTIMQGEDKILDFDGSSRKILDLEAVGAWKKDSRGYIVPNMPYEE